MMTDTRQHYIVMTTGTELVAAVDGDFIYPARRIRFTGWYCCEKKGAPPWPAGWLVRNVSKAHHDECNAKMHDKNQFPVWGEDAVKTGNNWQATVAMHDRPEMPEE